MREEKFRPLLLLAQRFVYRQLMYSVVIRATSAALSGLGIGWGKLERTGRVTSPAGRADTGAALPAAKSAEGQPQPGDQPLAEVAA